MEKPDIWGQRGFDFGQTDGQKFLIPESLSRLKSVKGGCTKRPCVTHYTVQNKCQCPTSQNPTKPSPLSFFLPSSWQKIKTWKTSQPISANKYLSQHHPASSDKYISQSVSQINCKTSIQKIYLLSENFCFVSRETNFGEVNRYVLFSNLSWCKGVGNKWLMWNCL